MTENVTANLHFPRITNAIDEIQREVFPKYGLVAGNYSMYTAKVENFYYDSSLIALEGYGLPIEISSKFEHDLYSEDGLDGSILKLSQLKENRVELSKFESEILKMVQSSL